jgi:hypothetical protein
MKFLAVHRVSLRSNRECCVDCPLPYHRCWLRTKPPHRYRQWVANLKWHFWRLPSVPWNAVTWTCDCSTGCHSSSSSSTSTSPTCKHHLEQELVAFSYPWCFFSGGLHLVLNSGRLRAVVQLSLLRRCFMKVTFYSAQGPLSGRLNCHLIGVVVGQSV